MSWLNEEQLKKFKSVGRDVLVSDQATIFGPENVELGDNVRIDAGCVILAAKGSLRVANHVHIAAQVLLAAGGGIILHNHTSVSFGSKIISSSDDFSGEYLCGPAYPEAFRKITNKPVVMKKFSQVGAACVVFPGITLEEGAVLGSNSLANKDLPEWMVCVGSPAKPIKDRLRMMSRAAESFEREYEAQEEV
jgi:galactoside O-acetyltransferase